MTSHSPSSVRKKRMAVVALVAGAVGVPVSFAQSPPIEVREGDIPSVTVKFDPADLQTRGGSRALYNRLKVAAEKVCPERAGTLMAISQNLAAQRCIDETVERAVKDVNNPRFAEAASTYMR